MFWFDRSDRRSRWHTCCGLLLTGRGHSQNSKGLFTHSTPFPCHIHAVLLKATAQHGRLSTAVLCCGLEKNGTVRAWHEHGMASVNQTRPHCVNQMGKTNTKPLAARHGRGMGTACYVWIGLNWIKETNYDAVFAFEYDLNLQYESRWRMSAWQLDTWHPSYRTSVISLDCLSSLHPHTETCREPDRSVMALVSAGSLLTAGAREEWESKQGRIERAHIK